MPTLAIPRSLLTRLAACLLLASLTTAACSTPLITPPPAPTSTPTAEPARRMLDIFTDRTTTETTSYVALLSEFATRHPEFDLHDAANEDANANALTDHLSRLHNSSPLDSWQVRIGQQAIDDYAKTGLVEPINFLFAQYDWAASLPSELIPFLAHKGNLFIAPSTIQRTNLLWYNPRLLATQSIPVPATLDELVAALDAFKAAGIATPLALGNQETVLHLFETVLLGALGPETYNSLWTDAGDWSRPELTAALEQFSKLLSFANPDATLDWQQAAQLALDGGAAFYIMDDRLANFAQAENKDQNLAYALAPGTSGIFQFGGGGFVLSASPPNRRAAITWLVYIGSQPAQDAFNPDNDSIPARLDADRTRYDVFHQAMMQDWAASTLAGSLSLGAVVNDAWKTEIESALTGFLESRDIAAFQTALTAACKTSGPCP